MLTALRRRHAPAHVLERARPALKALAAAADAVSSAVCAGGSAALAQVDDASILALLPYMRNANSPAACVAVKAVYHLVKGGQQRLPACLRCLPCSRTQPALPQRCMALRLAAARMHRRHAPLPPSHAARVPAQLRASQRSCRRCMAPSPAAARMHH